MRATTEWLAVCSIMFCSGTAVAAESLSPVYGQVLASSTMDLGQLEQMLGSMLRALEGALAELSALSDTITKWTGGTVLSKDGVIGEALRVVSQVTDQVGSLWEKIEKDLVPTLKGKG